jgi:hypothetical protein
MANRFDSANTTAAQSGCKVCQDLGLYELIGGLAGDARSMDAVQPNFVFGTYVLRHEADNLGLKPTSGEILETIKNMPRFQTTGVFDPSKYNSYVQYLGSMGFTAEQIEEAAGDDLRLEKLKKSSARRSPRPQRKCGRSTRRTTKNRKSAS